VSDPEGTGNVSDNGSDTVEMPASDRDTEALQLNDVSESAAVEDDIDEDAITNLPGTGGPDDGGDVDVDPGELRL